MTEPHDKLIALVSRGAAPFLREHAPGALRVGRSNVGLEMAADELAVGPCGTL